MSDRPYTDLALVATYPNYNLSIPLRAYKHQANKISIVVDINRPSSCGYSVVEKLENSAGNSITWLGKMIAAQELSGRSGEAACSEPLKGRVSKVWFDSSYQLSTVSRYFRLDPASHKNISQFDKFTQHANLYKKYADTIYAKHLYEVMRNLFAEEKFDEAIKLGNLLVFDIRNDPFIGQYNKISKDQLEKDITWFKTKKNS